MTSPRKPKRKATLAGEARLFSTLIFATLVLTAGALAFSLAAALAIRSSGMSYDVHANLAPSSVVETLNYHAFQAPQDFPPELLRGKIGNFISSQEMVSRELGALKFVSFKSRIPAALAATYYKAVLERWAYRWSESPDAGRSHLISAQRGSEAFDIDIAPAPAGSSVAIYQRVGK